MTWKKTTGKLQNKMTDIQVALKSLTRTAEGTDHILNIDNFFSLQIYSIACTKIIKRISQPIRRTFPPEKCDLNSTCVLCAEGVLLPNL
jgi:hypothetical protein